MIFTRAALQKETTFKASRSGGKGGQNVNKVSTKVELGFDIDASALFTDEEKEVLRVKLQSRFNKEGAVQVVCDEERSQYLNREKALEKLFVIITKAFEKPKVRKPSKVSKAAKAARVAQKRMQAAKKNTRKNDFDY